jgi:UPF0716 protein FxsA
MARRQGLGVLRRAQSELAAGRLPASELVDGVLVLLAGALLLTPGVLTDALGFSCLLPSGRRILKAGLRRWLAKAVASGRVTVSIGSPRGTTHVDPMRDVTPRQPRSSSPPSASALRGSPEPPDGDAAASR